MALAAGAEAGREVAQVSKTCENVALEALDLGLSPLPPREDGSKAPLADRKDERGQQTWKPYQELPATRDHVRRWFGSGSTGIGLVGGYGDLEAFEFDDRHTYEQFLKAARATGLGELVERVRAGYEETTPGAGVHWLYRCSKVQPCTKLARSYKTQEEFNEDDLKAIAEAQKQGRVHRPIKTLIETKGQGGFIIIAPSNGRVHPTGGTYRLERGGLRTMVTLTPEDRDQLWDLSRTFDEMPEPVKGEKSHRTRKPVENGKHPDNGKSPGDDFEERTSWPAILEPFGWQIRQTRGEVTYWTRPGKDEGVSATTGFCKGLKVFSTSTPFDTKGTHSKLHAYVVLNHDGDYDAAIKALVEDGYGTWIDSDGQEKQNPPPARMGSTDPASSRQASSPQADPPTVTAAMKAHVVKVAKDACQAVSDALEAKQLPTLHGAAFLIGQMLWVDEVNRDEAEKRLFLVAESIVKKTSAEAVRETIKKGLDAGEKKRDPLSHLGGQGETGGNGPAAAGFEAGQATAKTNPDHGPAQEKQNTPPKDEEGHEKQNPPPQDGKAGKGDAGGNSQATAKQPSKAASYREQNGCLWCGRARLANFRARIVTTITRHDGEKTETRYEIKATHEGGQVRGIIVTAEKYDAMKWVYSLGADFAMNPGRDVKDLVRHAIQDLSTTDGIDQRDEYTSVGWIMHEGQWLYLHADGAIGPGGHTDTVLVDLNSAMLRYRFPTQQANADELRAALSAHQDIWSLTHSDRPGSKGAAAITATLPWRAVLDAFDVTVHLGGPSGNRKTSLARVNLQHFTDLTGRDTPLTADWRATLNGLQRCAHDAKDSILGVDDLKTDKELQTAEAMIQSQGNLQGRLRMNVVQGLQQALRPRGSLLSTGEVDPRTQSTLGRVLVLEIQAGNIDLAVLTHLQAAGDAGRYRALMAAYIRWLAPRLDQVRSEHARLTAVIRTELGDIKGAHPRFPEMIAQLVAAYRCFMNFATERALVTPAEAEELVDDALVYLRQMGADQAELQQQSKLGRRFLDYIASALSAGRGHLVSARNATQPPVQAAAHAYGWWSSTRTTYEKDDNGETREVQVTEYFIPPGSKCLGAADVLENFVYLDPDESLTLVTELARSHGNLQSFANVGRELVQEGLVEPEEEDGKVRSKRQKRLHGSKRRFYWVHLQCLIDSVVPTVPTPDPLPEKSGDTLKLF
jgi:hypothetical protein